MGESSLQQPFIFRDKRQERIYKRLKLVGLGTPAYFKDACRLKDDVHPPLETTTHLISHLLREIDSSIRKVLAIFTDIENKPKTDNHKWEILQILRSFEVSEEDPIARLWLKYGRGLEKRAHRDDLGSPRSPDEEFSASWDAMLTVFDTILTKFESRYLSVHESLDIKLQIENPTNADASWLKKHVPNNQAAIGYFFDRLSNPKWLRPLKAEGVFDRPLEPIYELEKKSIFFPPWPQSRYLIRMAAVESDEVKATVGSILLGIETTNFYIHLDIVDAACHLPLDLASRVADRETEWLRNQKFIGDLIPDKFGDLTVYLANGNRVAPALAIASTLLGFVPVEVQEVSAAESFFWPDPQMRMERWDFGQFVHKCWKSLAQADWSNTLQLFCNLLNEYLTRKYPERIESGESNSYLWHRAIEHDEDGLRNRLVSTIRCIAEMTVSADPLTLERIVEILESHRWDVFERIVFHLLRLYPADAQAEIASRLLKKDNFQNVDFFHEYVLLLDESFNDLDHAAQQTILGWIDSSAPSVEEVKRRKLEWDGTELSEEDAEKSIRFGKLKWLEPLKEVLPTDWREKYEAWTDELGHPDHPGYRIGVAQAEWGGEPPTSNVLSKFVSVREIRDYLSKSVSEISEPPQDLGRELSQLVADAPERFLPDAEQFKELAPVYIRAFLSGIRSSSIPEETWTNLLSLINWVMEQPSAEVNLSDDSFDPLDTDWVQTRMVIGEFVSSLFAEGTLKILPDLLPQIWPIIRGLTDDPNPTPEYEARYGGANMDPLTISMNTIRGNAFHTMFKYLYLCSKDQSSGDGFHARPEVREVLEGHLDAKLDNSLAIRAVYGERLPFLVPFDSVWVREHLSEIFPAEESGDVLRKSAWETFVIYTRPWDNVFVVLKEEYEKAIDRLGDESLYRSESSANHLAEHLIAFYARGRIGVEDGGLLDKFYRNASDRLCAHVFWSLGRNLKGNEVPNEVVERIMHLVRLRISVGRPRSTEMEAFGWLFTSGKFEAEWSLLQLRDTLELTPSSDPDHSVIETLSEFSSRFPRLVIECISLLVDGADTEWKVRYWSPQIRTAITTAMENGGVDLATILVNKLAARGFLDFRDLLPE